jgi:hypothetical protein
MDREDQVNPRVAVCREGNNASVSSEGSPYDCIAELRYLSVDAELI